MKKYYLTSAIPYVNAAPHIGHALEFIQADTIKRLRILQGHEVKFLCGSDENALKNVQSAEKAGKPVIEFINENALLFETLARKLNVIFDIFQKGSSESHHLASKKLWELCDASGDIYRKTYKGVYCVGCEEFKLPNDLNVSGECPEHPGKALEEVKEDNYFFKLSKYQDRLLSLIESGDFSITPEFRKKEILTFIKSGLQDFSISRSNARARNWGVPVPNDSTQRMYVWFDALNIYQSGIGFAWNNAEYNDWWPADLHVIGKGIIRFHAVYWPAILLSAGLKVPRGIFVHEYFTVNGQKMSKTLGNVIDPSSMVEKYGTDALRYYCLAKISPFQDGDFSEDKLRDAYNSDLANGLGNLVARIAKLAENSGTDFEVNDSSEDIYSPELTTIFDEFRFNEVLQNIWQVQISKLDKNINQESPWLVKDKDKLKIILQEEINQLRIIARQLLPFLPETAEAIIVQFKGPKIVSQKPLFPRI